MRAVGEFDNDGNLRNMVYPEMATRVLMQFKKLWQALHSLQDSYPEEKTQEILRHLAKSNMHPLRNKVLGFLAEHPNDSFTTNAIAHNCLIGVKPANMQLSMLRSLDLAERLFEEETDSFGKLREKIRWQLKPGPVFNRVWSAGFEGKPNPTLTVVEVPLNQKRFENYETNYPEV